MFSAEDIKNYLRISDGDELCSEVMIEEISCIMSRAESLGVLDGQSEYQDFCDLYEVILNNDWAVQLFRLCETDEAFKLSYNNYIYGISSHFNSAKENLKKVTHSIK